METFDFDRQIRLMELAGSDEEARQLSVQMHDYIDLVPELKNERLVAWKAALARLRERSAIELATFKELLGQPTTG